MVEAQIEVTSTEIHASIEDVIRKGCWYLDKEMYGEWLDLFAETGRYEVVAYSPEIRKEMTWMRQDRAQLANLLHKELPNHIREDATRAHMVMAISIESTGDSPLALSRFAIFKTNARGETGVYATGFYEDTFVNENSVWKIAKRKVLLDTRMFDVFPHIIPV